MFGPLTGSTWAPWRAGECVTCLEDLMSVAERRLEQLTTDVWSSFSISTLVLGMWLQDAPRPGCTSPPSPLVTWFVTCSRTASWSVVWNHQMFLFQSGGRHSDFRSVCDCRWSTLSLLRSLIRSVHIWRSYSLQSHLDWLLDSCFSAPTEKLLFSSWFDFFSKRRRTKCSVFLSALAAITRDFKLTLETDLHSELQTSRTVSSSPQQPRWSPSPSSSELLPLGSSRTCLQAQSTGTEVGPWAEYSQRVFRRRNFTYYSLIFTVFNIQAASVQPHWLHSSEELLTDWFLL